MAKRICCVGVCQGVAETLHRNRAVNSIQTRPCITADALPAPLIDEDPHNLNILVPAMAQHTTAAATYYGQQAKLPLLSNRGVVAHRELLAPLAAHEVPQGAAACTCYPAQPATAPLLAAATGSRRHRRVARGASWLSGGRGRCSRPSGR